MREAAAGRASLRTRVAATVGSIASMTLVGCTLGVVDLGPDPSPARMYVRSEVGPHPELRGQVLVTVEAELDPGVDPSGAPRGFVSDVLHVDGIPRPATKPGVSGYSSWNALAAHQAPGPIAVELRFPWIEALPPPSTVNMRVQIPITPADTLVVAEGADLLIEADPPTNPFESLEAMTWELVLTSRGAIALPIVVGGQGSWPRQIRVPSARVDLASFPLDARFTLRWRRSLVVFDLTAVERLELTLESDMRAEWTVVRPAPVP